MFRRSWFGRTGRHGHPARGGGDPARAAAGSDDPAEEDTGAGPGPYDVDDVPNDGVHRIDLGSLLVPVVDGVDYRFSVEGDAGRVVAVVATAGGSSMEISAYAAPKTSGLWDQVREQLRRSEAASGDGRAEVIAGRHGPELVVHDAGAGIGGSGPVRVLGIDGPRWMLHATITGPAAADAAESLLDDVLVNAIVMRGEHALPVGVALPLRLPSDTDLPEFDDGTRAAAETDPLGRVRPTGTGSADPRRVSYEVISAPVGGLSRNLTTWG